MKKKFSEITVGDKKYGWIVKHDYSTSLTIWFDKKIIHKEIIKDGIDITPKFVADLIIQNNL
jgi:hypothetical protein